MWNIVLGKCIFNRRLQQHCVTMCMSWKFRFSTSNFASRTSLKLPETETQSHFDKILIANRGEIACRVIKTARHLGIKTVAVYSTSDSQSLHTRLADEAVWIGESASQFSYLCIEKVVEAAKKTGSQAVHPGYGFLSENAAFAKKLEDVGITFIGPSSDTLSVMGDKLASKQLAKSAGVNVIPGCEEVIISADQCVEAARQLGYPVMIKALAGGGGKGMRVAHSDLEAREFFNISKEEAASSFGDEKMLVEKFIENPRHIEFQVLGDKFGNVIHLFERECSIQRRNQKVIEEAPSVLLSSELRKEMGDQALALCDALKYSSAGTVEFLVDPKSGKFFFLEMNPRLQVEHPITEAVTGVDLVQLALSVAKGHPLKLKQEDICQKGWAIECRVYAENPYIDFGLPSIGRLHTYIEPSKLNNVRCDSGVEEGSEISIHYDPLISKLVCFGETRREAIDLSIKALDSYVIRGISNNISLLRDILSQPRFDDGHLSTNFLQQVHPEGFKGRKLSPMSHNYLLAAVCSLYASEDLRARCFKVLNVPQPRTLRPPPSSWHLSLSLQGGHPQEALVCRTSGHFEVQLDGGEKIQVLDDINLSSPLLPLHINGKIYNCQSVTRNATGLFKLIWEGTTFSVTVMTNLAAKYSQYMLPKTKTDFSKTVVSPMPGLVKSVSCQVGNIVIEGQELCVIEAMKMQNSLCAIRSGKVKEVKVEVGKTVSKNELLVLLE